VAKSSHSTEDWFDLNTYTQIALQYEHTDTSRARTGSQDCEMWGSSCICGSPMFLGSHSEEPSSSPHGAPLHLPVSTPGRIFHPASDSKSKPRTALSPGHIVNFPQASTSSLAMSILRYFTALPAQSPQASTRHDSDPVQREQLRKVARETSSLSRDLLENLTPAEAREAQTSTAYTLETLRRLDPNLCPRHPRPATIKVVNQDTLSAAIEMSEGKSGPPPLIVNFANRHSRGGGWRNGAVAQEEALCYRSTLAMTLDQAQYPLARTEALYSPYVLVLRDEMADGHDLLDPPYPIVSVVTVAAINRPEVTTFTLNRNTPGLTASSPLEKHVFALDRDRNYTKDKMRLTLRLAAVHGHDMLVLGALGCGVFQNPPEDVACCWAEVLKEYEFKGNWWREVWFAVFDRTGEGNFETFSLALDGQRV